MHAHFYEEKPPKKQKKQKKIRPQQQKCMICDEKFALDELATHLCIDRSELICEYCTKPFESLNELKEHLNNDHSNEEKLLYVCDICRRAFPMRSLMDCHRKYHKAGCYSCKKCNKTFDTVLQKEKHLFNDHIASSKSLF